MPMSRVPLQASMTAGIHRAILTPLMALVTTMVAGGEGPRQFRLIAAE
jgi:hypothetical protein